jgi:hypothetical protein
MTKYTWRTGVLGIDWADVNLPEQILVSAEDAITLPDEVKNIDRFKGFSYHLVKVPFGLTILGDKSRLLKPASITAEIDVQNLDSLGTLFDMPAIFPRDGVVTIGKVTDKYQLYADFSIKTPELDVPLPSFIKFEIPGGRAAVERKKVWHIAYDLKIPKVQAHTNGNNSANWTFFFDEAIEPQAQYRVDMVVGIPKERSKDSYGLTMKMRCIIRRTPFRPTPIEHDGVKIIFR